MQLSLGDLSGPAEVAAAQAGMAFQADTLKMQGAAAASQGRMDAFRQLIPSILGLEAGAGRPVSESWYDEFNTSKPKSAGGITTLGWLAIGAAGLVTARKLGWI